LIRITALILALTVVARPGFAADPVFLLPPGISIGMDRAALRALQPPLRALAPALNFGPVQAEFIDTSIERLGAPGTLYFQMDPVSGRLRQLLFEWRDARVSGDRAADMLARLDARLGEPEMSCVTTMAGQGARRVSARWTGSAIVLRVSMVDHRSSDIAYFDPNTDANPRRPSHERRRITRRSLPRRLVARLHAADDVELWPRRGCQDGSAPENR
jgi:hypothetical protein